METGPLVRKEDKNIHQINHYPADSICFVNTYLLDSDLSSGLLLFYLAFKELGPGHHTFMLQE